MNNKKDFKTKPSEQVERKSTKTFQELKASLIGKEMTLKTMDEIVLANTGDNDSIYQCGIKGLIQEGEGSCDYGRIGRDCYNIVFDVLEDNEDTSKIWIKVKNIELL